MENINASASYVSKKTALTGWIICSLGALFYCYEYLLRIQPSVMLPELMQQFSVSADQVSVLVSLYYLAYTPMQLVVGVITDLYGPRYILTFAVFICALGSFFFGLADSLYLAAVGRFFVGLGSAFAFVSALKLASIWLPLNRFALFAGLVTMLGMVGGMVGDIGLTLLVASIGWKQTLYLSAIVGGILLPLIWLIIRDKKSASEEQSRPAIRLMYQETFSGLLVILRNRQAWIAGLMGGILYLSLSVFAELWGIPFLKAVYHLNANQAAYANSAVFFGWMIGAPLMGWVSDKMQKRKLPLFFGALISAMTSGWIIYVPSTPMVIVVLLLFLFGVFSSIQVVCFAVGREANPESVSGAAISFVNLLVMLGGLAFQPLVGKILDRGWSGYIEGGVRLYSTYDYQVAMTLIPVSILLGTGLSFLLRETFTQALDR